MEKGKRTLYSDEDKHMNILMNSMYYVCEQCFYLKITKNSLYPKCILSFLLNGLCVFLTSEYIHINWLSTIVDSHYMFECFYKGISYIRICHFKFDCCLISNNEYPSIPFFNYRILCAFNNTHNRWMCNLLSNF